MKKLALLFIALCASLFSAENDIKFVQISGGAPVQRAITASGPITSKESFASQMGLTASVNGIEPSGGNVNLTPPDIGAATAPTSTTLSGGGPYALTLGPAPYPRYTVAISAATTFTVSGSPNAGDGAIIENTVSGAPRVVTYPTAYRNNAAATGTSISVSSPRSEFFLKYTGSEYRWYDQEYTLDDAASLSYAADAGSTDSYAITLYPAPTAYVTGTQYRFKANTANTGAATLNVNGLGAKTIVKYAGGANTTLADNDIRSGQHVLCVYDGTYMQMQSTLGNAAAGGGWTSGILFTTGSTSPVISNSTAETSIFSGTIPANVLATGSGIRFSIFALYLNDTGSTSGMNFKLKFGSDVIWADSGNGTWFSTSSGSHVMLISGELKGSSSTVQYGYGNINISSALGATTGYGDATGASTGSSLGVQFGGVTSSVDSTSSQTLDFLVTLTGTAGASTNHKVTVLSAICWKL